MPVLAISSYSIGINAVALLNLVQLSQSTFNIKYQPPGLGLYIEHLGEAQINRGNLRIELQIARTTLETDKEGISRIIAEIKELCDKYGTYSDSIHCDGLLGHLTHEGAEIKAHIENLSQRSRKKRGLLGKLLETVFGVHDDIYTDIHALSDNQDHLLQTTKHQTAIMLSTLAQVNDTEQKIAQKLVNFQERLDIGKKYINIMLEKTNKIDSNRLNIHFLASYHAAINYLKELEEKYTRLQNALMRRAHLLDFLTPSNVADILKNVSAKLPSNFIIPALPKSTLEVKLEETHLKLYGYFYILEKNKFELITATAIPHKVKDSIYTVLDLKTPTLAIDYNSQLYFELKDEEIKDCNIGEKYSCFYTPNVVHKIDEHPNCIINEIYNRPNVQQCQLHQMTIPQLIWKRLHMTNTWLFIANIPTSAAIVCRGVREDVILNGTGVIHTSPECSIQTRGNILKAEVITQYPVITTFSKTIRPPEIEAAKADKLEKIPPEPVLKATDLFSGLTIQDNAEENGTWRTVGPHFYSSMATITAMAIIILIIYLIRRRGFAVWFRKITLKQPTKEDRAEEPPAEELQEGHPTPPPRPNYVERRIGLSRRAECLYGQCNALST